MKTREKPVSQPPVPPRVLRSLWKNLPAASKSRFQEVWYLKFTDQNDEKGMWIRFTLLCSSNGYRRIAEAWAVIFDQGVNPRKLALKQTFPIDQFRLENGVISIGPNSHIDMHGTQGKIESKGHVISWNLNFSDVSPVTFDAVPKTLRSLGFKSLHVDTLSESLKVSGSVEIDGEHWDWKEASGMFAHHGGKNLGHSWAWGHCNQFIDESGKPVDVIFEGLNAHAKIAGPLASPALSSFLIQYQNKRYQVNSLWNALRARSENDFREWKFQWDTKDTSQKKNPDDLSFRGHFKAEHRDFAGMTYEDTDGSYLYCHYSQMATLTLWIYRNGKLETTLRSGALKNPDALESASKIFTATATFEISGKSRSPYVPLLV